MNIKLRARDPATQDDVDSILAALEANNPDDAAAARQGASQTASSKRATADDDVTAILAALAENNPEDAAAAKGALQKRQDDIKSILAALAQNNPEDAKAAQGLAKRWVA